MSRILPSAALLAALLAAGTVSAQPELDERLLLASPNTIDTDPALLQHMSTLAETAYDANCASCHGADYSGGNGVPNLADYDWLWGVTGAESTSTEPVFEIMQTILYGIRDRDCAEEVKRYGACPDTRYSEMPAYADVGFTDQQIDDLVEYVFMLSRQEYAQEAVTRAAPQSALCAECHGEEGYGHKPYGGPDLTDEVWLYGGTREQIRDVLAKGRLGTCPPWAARLNAVTIKALAVHLYRKSQGY